MFCSFTLIFWRKVSFTFTWKSLFIYTVSRKCSAFNGKMYSVLVNMHICSQSRSWHQNIHKKVFNKLECSCVWTCRHWTMENQSIRPTKMKKSQDVRVTAALTGAIQKRYLFDVYAYSGFSEIKHWVLNWLEVLNRQMLCELCMNVKTVGECIIRLFVRVESALKKINSSNRCWHTMHWHTRFDSLANVSSYNIDVEVRESSKNRIHNTTRFNIFLSLPPENLSASLLMAKFRHKPLSLKIYQQQNK